MSDIASSAELPRSLIIVLHQLGQGGVERVASILAREFKDQHIDVELLVCARGGAGEQSLKAIYGDRVKCRFFRHTMGNRLLDLILGFPSMGRYLQTRKPDVVMSAGNNVSLASMLLTRVFCPRETSLYIKTTNPVIRPKDSAMKKVFRFFCYAVIFRYSDGVLTLSDSESNQLKHLYPGIGNKVRTVANPYIEKRVVAGRSGVVHQQRSHRKTIVAVGRLHKQKRFDVLLHAFQIVRNNIDCELVILGEGEDRLKLVALSQALSISSFVELPGYVEDVGERLSKSDVFVLSSDYEGLPAVVLEALANNCPVVATECFHGIHELLRDASSCSITPVQDPVAMAEAILAVLQRKAEPGQLHPIANKYRTGPAVLSHLRAIHHFYSLQRC